MSKFKGNGDREYMGVYQLGRSREEAMALVTLPRDDGSWRVFEVTDTGAPRDPAEVTEHIYDGMDLVELRTYPFGDQPDTFCRADIYQGRARFSGPMQGMNLREAKDLAKSMAALVAEVERRGWPA